MPLRGIQRFWVLTLLTLALLGCVSGVLALSKFKPEILRTGIVHSIEELSDGTFTFAKYRFSFFPLPYAEFSSVQLTLKNHPEIVLKADSFRLYFEILPAVFGRADAAKLEIQGGAVSGILPLRKKHRSVNAEKIKFIASPIKPNTPIHLEWEGFLKDVKQPLRSHLTLTIPDFKRFNWNQTNLDGYLLLKEVDLREWTPVSDSAVRFESGVLSGKVSFSKPKEFTAVDMVGSLVLNNFTYQTHHESNYLKSPDINGSLSFDLGWDPFTETVTIKSGNLVSPLGDVEFKGESDFATGQIREFQARIMKVQLDSIPQYLVWFKDAIPFNLGFSGQSDIEFSMNGTFDHLSIHANVDLTPAVLTYSRFFYKPKDIPLNLSFDYLLKDTEVLSGDFSIRFLDTRVKGNISALDLRTLIGSVNFITNKFTLDGWQAYLLPLERYQLGGEMKVLANLTGNLKKMSPVQPMINLTLTKGKLTLPSGPGLRNISLSLDYGPVALEVKEARFVLNKAAYDTHMVVYNFPEQPKAKFTIKSPRFEPQQLLGSLRNLFYDKLSKEHLNTFRDVEKSIRNFFPKGETLDRFSAGVEYEKKKWTLTDAHFETYGGAVGLQASLDLNTENPAYTLKVDSTRLSLARFQMRGGRREKFIDGNFFLAGAFQGKYAKGADWQTRVSGEGSLSITNGEFYGFDLLSPISKLNGFSLLEQYLTGHTVFTDVRSDFSLKSGKVMSEKLFLLSGDLTVEASGETTLEGILNYRLDVFLSPALTDQVLAPILKRDQIEGDQQFGPVPLLLAGPLENAEVKPNPELLSQMMDLIARKKTQKIFRNFLPEDFLFERRTHSS